MPKPGELKVFGVWEFIKQFPREERKDLVEALRSAFRGKTEEDLKEEASPVYELPAGETRCFQCGGELIKETDGIKSQYAGDLAFFHCDECDLTFGRDLD